MAGFNWGSVDWGSIAGAAASMYSSNQASKAAKGAGNAAAAGSDAATALQGQIYQDQRNLNMPFYNSQVSALNQYNALLGLPQTQGGSGGGSGGNASLVGRDPSGVPIANAQLYASDPSYKAAWDATVQQHQGQWKTGYWNGSDANWIDSNVRSRLPSSWTGGQSPTTPGQTKTPQQLQQEAFAQFRNQPGYQFGLDQGNKSVQTSAAARGGLYSGAAMKALQRYGNDYADQQGFTPYMNRIASAAGIGQTNPVGSLTSAAGQYGQNAGGLMQNAANARASGMQNAANAKQQGWNDAAGFLGQWYGGRG